MKNYILVFILAIIGASSCKKECSQPASQMPRAVVKVNGKLSEISKTIGNTPSVVLIGGFGAELSTWEKLYQSLNNTSTTVFAYNRPGLGLSENVTGNRDAATIAAEIKVMLEANQIQPPYVLVAHSMGGIYARMFHHLNPGKVKGLVLVDATHEKQLDSLLSFIPLPDRDFVYNEMQRVNDSIVNTMPAGAIKEEFRANFTTNHAQIKMYPAITNVPVYIISSLKPEAGSTPLTIDIHKALHKQWADAAAPQSRFITTDKSGHFIQVEEPALVAEGIKWILAK